MKHAGTHVFLPTERVHFGLGSLEQVEVEARSKDRAFVVTGRSLYEKTDLVRRVEVLLGEKHAGTFPGMGQHTPDSSVEDAAREARGSDLLVSVGGGSVVDGTKAVARKLGYPTHVAVPTTLSGAEWAHRVGVTDEASGRKGGFADPKAVPQVVVLDPEATLFTPEKLWLSTGIRALDHAVEGLLYGGEHPVTDVTGTEGARRLVAYLSCSKENPEDVEVRG
jgi:maleylacetate reductase